MTATPAKLGLMTAIERAGGQSALARKLHVKRQVVGGWVRRGRVPVDWAERVSDATGVPAWQLAPDVYWPEPYSTLPPHEEDRSHDSGMEP